MLTCDAEGYPKPNITWFRPNGKSIPGKGFSYQVSGLFVNRACVCVCVYVRQSICWLVCSFRDTYQNNLNIIDFYISGFYFYLIVYFRLMLHTSNSNYICTSSNLVFIVFREKNLNLRTSRWMTVACTGVLPITMFVHQPRLMPQYLLNLSQKQNLSSQPTDRQPTNSLILPLSVSYQVSAFCHQDNKIFAHFTT